MNNRQRVNAILHFQPCDRVPAVAFGYWNETVDKWAQEGHITPDEALGYRQMGDGSPADVSIMQRLGFDFNWSNCLSGNNTLHPPFVPEVLRVEASGAKVMRNHEGLIVRVHDDIVSIPSEIGTSLTGREAWETLYLPRLRFSPDRVDHAHFKRMEALDDIRDIPLGLHLGSLYGFIRNLLGVEELAYLEVDDEELYQEIIDTVADMCFQLADYILRTYKIHFDYAHFWEDICFKNGPLVSPRTFDRFVGRHYKRLTDLVHAHGIDIVSLDCDGCIDALIPTWLHNGVNTMFPIEVGTWNASIAPWRQQYGKSLRGVGGVDKRVFAGDKQAVEQEIERLKPLVDAGGFIPCIDHRIPPDAHFALVQYYCECFRKAFG
ncbi:MAG: hypothetical protein E7326_03435 [Clostridiales bacterium]|nr:hypothetical protein [Clostridiales bacterium]